ncbi:MAG: acyl-CoA/acyl-ACP dehydrogenase [Patulibacter minatonensis]
MPEAPLVDQMARLGDRGLLAPTAFATRGDELDAVRAVAARGIGAGRVFDGHRNALERLLVHRPADLPDDFHVAVARGDHLLGVWGADPGAGDGSPAVLAEDGRSVTGVKTFCSGAGVVDHAIVLVRRTADGPPTLPVVIDLRDPDAVRIDRAWFTSLALAESHSHRVEFERAPVVAVLGTEGTLSEEPWISGDALRSTAVWAGAAETLLARMLAASGGGPAADERVGRAAAIVQGAWVWLGAGLDAVLEEHEGGAASWPTVAAMRLELTERLRDLLRLAAEHGGSRGLVHDTPLHEARDGLDLLLLQHRLAPTATRLGAHARGAR